MFHYTLYKDISGDSYIKLIEHSLRKSDCFMLVYFGYGQAAKMKRRAREIHDRLKTLKIKTRYDPMWPHMESLDNRNTYKVVFYRAETGAESVLCSVDSLFSWNYPMPMDLCFFSDGLCWMATTAHEEMVNFYFKTREEADEIMSFGIPIGLCGEISDERVYSEDYRIV